MIEPTPLAVEGRTPPPIPAARADSADHSRQALLVWVRAGAACVHLDDVVFRIADGEGVWIPADGWGRRLIVTEPGTVAFPLSPHVSVGAGAPTEPTRFEVSESWQDWLIQLFNLQVTPLGGDGYSQDVLVRLLTRRGPLPRLAPGSRDAELPTIERAALPRSAGARAVAEDLVRDPALDLTVAEWAARVASSPRTLRRDFVADTGLTFEQWRLRCRLGAAIELFHAGYDVDQVSARVGFESRNGFTRAFRQQFGATPHELCRHLFVGPTGELTQRGVAARQGDNLVQMMGDGDISAGAPDLLPAARTPPHTNDRHVLSWIYRGSGYVDLLDDRYERQRGDATWIPADIEHVTGLRENSISLPLGNASTGDLQLTEPLQVPFSSAWDDYLMSCSVSARSVLRPDGYDPRHILDLFTEQVAAQRALSVPMPTEPRARAVATDYLRRLGSGGETALDVPTDVHRAFRVETGMTFAGWRYATRMRIARDLLAGQTRPSSVARRIGYTHLPNFSAAFTRFHGISPREFQDRETEGA